ncbi:DUF6194 family protein [Hominisplanchenecus murintestinalis]|uniref:DUF6194 family protein n=1 Tax=Hominisplanchenecus murintestinalis TaxID=2941517 RepID=UPI002ED60F87
MVPHPVYAWMAWICALNPSEQTFEELKPYIQESYEYNICQLIGNQIVIHLITQTSHIDFAYAP